MLSCFKGFLGCLQPRSLSVKDINIRGASVGSTFAVKACVRGTCIESTCVNSVNAVKYSEIHLQSFWILKVKLFNTGLEIRVGAGWLLLGLY